MGELRQVPGLLAVHARLNLLLLMRSRQQAITYLISDVVGQLAGLVGVVLLATTFDGIAGWTRAQVVFLLGYGLSVRGLETTFFSYNLAAVSRRVGRGQLDHSLLQPQSLLLTFSTEGFAPVDGAALLIPGVGLLVGAANAGAGPVGLLALLLLPLLIVGSTLVLVGFNFIWGSLAFWAPSGAEELSPVASNLLRGLSTFPLDPLIRGLKVTLVTVVPAGHMAWIPAGAVLGRSPLATAGWTFGAAAVVLTLATVTFARGLAHYGYTGSQRYSDFGHRR